MVQVLNMQGCHVWRTNAGLIPQQTNGRFRMVRVGQAGQSDIIGLRKKDGRFISIEVKKPQTKSRVSPDQKLWLDSMLSFNALAGVATTVEEALAIIRS